MSDPADFLARWSRLKQKSQSAAPESPAVLEAGAALPATNAPPTVAPGAAPAELPPLDSLTKDSDFSVFMRPGVPESARSAALKKLWRSDPVFANLDGLIEYGDDFAADFRSTAAVATVYRVLQGMPGGEAKPLDKPEKPPAEPDSTAAGTPPVDAKPATPAPAEATETSPESAAAGSGRPPKDGLG
jgi:Protein of unknown function (DUF3306)